MSTQERPKVDVASLRKFFLERTYHGIVELIDVLQTKEMEGILSIGSSTIGLDEILKADYATEEDRMRDAWLKTKKLHIGSRDGSVTPIEWIQKLMQSFGNVRPEAMVELDKICKGFAQMAKAPRVPYKDTSDESQKIVH